jgi:hypothetical protein
MAPRLSPGRALRPVPHLEIEDDGVYTDMHISHAGRSSTLASLAGITVRGPQEDESDDC